MGRGCSGLLGREEHRAELHRGCPERERGGDAPPVGDAAGRDDRCSHGIHDLGHEGQGADERILWRAQERGAVPAGLHAGGDDQVEARGIQGDCFFDRGGRPDRDDAEFACSVEHRQGGHAEHEAQCGGSRGEDRLDLLVERR
jgi:hypothetical protein